MNLSVKNVPEALANRLRARAERNHRSMQGELLAIIEAAVDGAAPLSPNELLAEVRRIGVSGPDESTALIRAMRDGR